MGIQRDGGRHLKQWRSTQSLSEYINSDNKSISRWNRRSHRSSNKFLRLIRSLTTRTVYNKHSRRRFPIYTKLFWTRAHESNDNTTPNRSRISHFNYKYIYPVSTLLLSLISPTVSLAQGVGGVSATANPIANSSGSVTNQAIQVLQGPYITNTYGNGIQCQGATANFTPYIQYSDSRKHPWEDYYMEPQYNMNDFTGKMTEVTTTVKNYPWYNGWKHGNDGQLVYDDDGNKIPIDENWYNTATYVDANGDTVRWWEDGAPMEITVDVDGPDGKPDNPGEVVWEKPVRTDMRANQNFNLGLSATLSVPLNRSMQRLCQQAATTQIEQQLQLTANKRLDFEIARLKNCGELMQKGIMFHPKSPYAAICGDVMVTQARPGSLPDHTHQLSNTTSSPSEPSSESELLDSDLSALPSVQKQKEQGQFFRGLSLPWQKSSSPTALSPSEASPLGAWQVGQMK